MKEVEILQEISKNSKTGIDGINFILDKVKNEDLYALLINEKREYNNIYDRAKEILIQMDSNVEDTSAVQKTMSWMGIEFSTLTDSSSSKIAEILMQGNEMGIVKGIKTLNSMDDENPEIRNLLKDFISLQQKNNEDLKKYL